MYKIKLDDTCTVFSLYQDDVFMGTQTWIGQHLLNIGKHHGIDLSKCESESHMLSILECYIDIEIVD